MAGLGERFAKLLYRVGIKIVPFLKNLLPMQVWSKIRSLLSIEKMQTSNEQVFMRQWITARQMHPWFLGSKEQSGGINLVGYLRAVKGIGEAARSSISSLRAVGIPYSVVDFEVGVPSVNQVEDLPTSQYGHGFKFNTNLIHMNPPELPYLWGNFRKNDLVGRYTIGVWYWELPDFPEEWRFAFNLVDEVWVGSQFVLDSVSAQSPVPVIKMHPCVQATFDQRLQRSDYNLPNDCFLFLCAYDVLSTQARKNPLAAIEAFKRAFPRNDPSVGLVVKINNSQTNPDEVRNLRMNLSDFTNVYFIEKILSRMAMNSLINLSDAYISLHRSEGFGLIPAEAMYLGKPVVMTRWSGNLDLMTADNSCGVDYRLIPVHESIGPYKPGQIWADPDIDHAAFFMRKLFSDIAYYSRIAERAKSFMRAHFSAEITGKRMKARFQQLGLL